MYSNSKNLIYLVNDQFSAIMQWLRYKLADTDVLVPFSHSL